MPDTKRFFIDIPPGFRSREAASFVSQMDNLSERMSRDLQTLTRDELSWQLAPGTNTIGMLLGHIAICEVWWIKRVMANDADAEKHVEDILGINADADGMPIAKDGKPPDGLRREKPFFDDLLNRARIYTTEMTRPLTDVDMECDVATNVVGEASTVTPRWTLYHLLEHQAGHYGQMLFLKQRMRG